MSFLRVPRLVFPVLFNWGITNIVFIARLTTWRLRLSKTEYFEGEPIIVSLTSYPARYKYLKKTLWTLITQSTRPNAIYVNLFEPDFRELPKSLINFSKHGVIFQSCKENLKSYLKLIPLVDKSDFSAVITVDDDICYPREMISELLLNLSDNPAQIIGHRGFKIDRDNEFIDSWDLICVNTISNSDIFLTGVGGILYPSQILKQMSEEIARVISLAPSADDLGYLFVQNKLHISRVAVGSKYSNPRYWPGSQTSALWRINVAGGANTLALQNLRENYYSL
jgi:hypothetical protein